MMGADSSAIIRGAGARPLRRALGGSKVRVSVSRYGLVKALIPLALALYLVMILLHWAADFRQTEIYPFFRWSLFSLTPGWERMDHAVVLRAVDGEPASGVRYLIPNDSIRDRKALELTLDACASPDSCDAAVESLLFPIVRRLANGSAVEFSIVEARVDLRAARREMQRLADGEARETDFFRPGAEIGRWTMSE